MFGDPDQRNLFESDGVSEFQRTTGTSLMVRLIRTRVPITQLKATAPPHCEDCECPLLL